MNSSITIQPADGVGAEICGVDLSRVAGDEHNDALINQLKTALGEHGVLFFHDQDLCPEAHIALAESFGTININRFFTPVEHYPNIAEVRKEPDHSSNIGSQWHTDHSYDIEPAMGSILVAKKTPTSGGDTVFCNMYSAFETLSEGLQQTLLSLNAVHSSRHVFGAGASRDEADYADRLGNKADATQDAVHPMVISHPISGRRALYVNPQFTVRIDGWSDSESKPLLDMLYRHAIRPEFTHRFKWRDGSIAFWDNRATWHCALNDYPGQLRLMHRITVAGVKLDAAAATQN